MSASFEAFHESAFHFVVFAQRILASTAFRSTQTRDTCESNAEASTRPSKIYFFALGSDGDDDDNSDHAGKKKSTLDGSAEAEEEAFLNADFGADGFGDKMREEDEEEGGGKGCDPLRRCLDSPSAYQHVRCLAVSKGGAVVFSQRLLHWGSRGRAGRGVGGVGGVGMGVRYWQ